MQALFQPCKNISPCFFKIMSLGGPLWSFSFLRLYPFFNAAPPSLSTSFSRVLSTSFFHRSSKSFSRIRRHGFCFLLQNATVCLQFQPRKFFAVLNDPSFFISHKCEPCISLQASIHPYALIFLFFSISFVLFELLWFSLSADSWRYILWCLPRTLE